MHSVTHGLWSYVHHLRFEHDHGNARTYGLLDEGGAVTLTWPRRLDGQSAPADILVHFGHSGRHWPTTDPLPGEPVVHTVRLAGFLAFNLDTAREADPLPVRQRTGHGLQAPPRAVQAYVSNLIRVIAADWRDCGQFDALFEAHLTQQADWALGILKRQLDLQGGHLARLEEHQQLVHAELDRVATTIKRHAAHIRQSANGPAEGEVQS